jgi:hypothetical protein
MPAPPGAPLENLPSPPTHPYTCASHPLTHICTRSCMPHFSHLAFGTATSHAHRRDTSHMPATRTPTWTSLPFVRPPSVFRRSFNPPSSVPHPLLQARSRSLAPPVLVNAALLPHLVPIGTGHCSSPCSPSSPLCSPAPGPVAPALACMPCQWPHTIIVPWPDTPHDTRSTRRTEHPLATPQHNSK